jgi:hypothetical protein
MNKTTKPQKCQVANCENEATKINRLSRLLYCDKHAAMPHHYKIHNRRVPFTYDKIVRE